MWLRKGHKVWVRTTKLGTYSYFDIRSWQFQDYPEPFRSKDFHDPEELVVRRRKSTGLSA
jgi:hypothetical protein